MSACVAPDFPTNDCSRRLTAILAAEVAGYPAAVGRHNGGTHERTEKDTQLWTERSDRDLDDPFALQNEITSITYALAKELIAAETARPTEHPDAFDYILRGRPVLLKPNSREAYVEAISWCERALALDPQSSEVMSRVAEVLVGRALDQMTSSAADDVARAIGGIAPQWYAYRVKGQVLRMQNRPDEALLEF
jgi:hypothetical protein